MKELDLNAIYEELHKQGFGYSIIHEIEDYIVLEPTKTDLTKEERETSYNRYIKIREKELLKYTGMNEDEIMDFTKLTKEEKDQVKYVVRYKKLKKELEELEYKIK